MALNIPGLIATIIFYLLVLGIGIWASIKSKRDETRTQAHHADMALLGDRKISLVVGIFTTTGEFVSVQRLRTSMLLQVAGLVGELQASCGPPWMVLSRSLICTHCNQLLL